jgi:hypothetical protein
MRGDGVVPLRRLERGGHGVVHGAGQRILLVGAQEAHHLHPALDLDLDVLGHVSPCSCTLRGRPPTGADHDSAVCHLG